MTIELNAVVDAAQALLDARRAGADCRPAWLALEGAVALAREAGPAREEWFEVIADHLVRRVAMGEATYVKRCRQRDYVAVARVVGAHRGTFVRDDLCRRAGVPRSAGLVAMMFLKQHGLVTPSDQRYAATARFSVEAALAAYAALEGRPAGRLAA